MVANTHDNDALNKLETQLGSGDRVLVEFIVDLSRSCHIVAEFDSKLMQNGAVLPDYFVRTLLTTIHAILPPEPKTEEAPMPDEEHKKSVLSTLGTEFDLNGEFNDGEGLRLKLKSF